MLDFLIIIGSVVLIVFAGLFSRTGKTKFAAYFLCDQKVSWWRTGFSSVQSHPVASSSLVALLLITTYGMSGVWILLSFGVVYIFQAFLVGPLFHRTGVFTDAEFSELRYGKDSTKLLRSSKALFYGFFLNGLIIALVLLSASHFLQPLFPWHEWMPGNLYTSLNSVLQSIQDSAILPGEAISLDLFFTMACLTAIVILYTVFKGYSSVLHTDVLQFILATVGLVAFFLFTLAESGGITSVLNHLTDWYGTARMTQIVSVVPSPEQGVFGPILFLALAWILHPYSDGSGIIAQRTLSTATESGIRNANFFAAVFHIVLRGSLWIFLSISLLALFPEQLTARTLTDFSLLQIGHICVDTLPTGISGVVIAGFIAGFMSILDSHLNMGAAYLVNDLFRARSGSTATQEKQIKHSTLFGYTLCIVFVGFLFSFLLRSPVVVLEILELTGAGMGGVLLLRWFWERVNVQAEHTALFLTIVLIPVSCFFIDDSGMRIVLLGGITNVITFIVMLSTPITKSKILDPFYKRVRPPGFWRTTATYSGFDPFIPLEELALKLFSTAAATASLFLFMIGFVKLFLSSPGSSQVLPMLFIALSVLLTPIWITQFRRVRKFKRPTTPEPFERLGE